MITQNSKQNVNTKRLTIMVWSKARLPVTKINMNTEVSFLIKGQNTAV